MFMHAEDGIATSVHGDDFTSAAPKCELDWSESKLRAKYELGEGGRLGPGPDDTKELTILNRVVQWTGEGIEYEADPPPGRAIAGIAPVGHRLQVDSDAWTEALSRAVEGRRGAGDRGARKVPSHLGSSELSVGRPD